MSKNVAAWTGPTPTNPNEYAEYISINKTDNDNAEITVRDKTGKQVCITLTPEQLAEFEKSMPEEL